MTKRKEYTQTDRIDDFHYFLEHYDEFFKKYGYCYIAIRFKEILGVYSSMQEAISVLSNRYKTGEYIVQEGNWNESGYTCYINEESVMSSTPNKVDYDQKFDVLYYNMSNTENSYGDEIDENIVLLRDIDTNKITGITILGYKRMLEK